MKISLSHAVSARPARMENGDAVFPMGSPVPLAARFVNDGESALSIDSPASSQEVLLWLATPDGKYRYMVNPSRIDRTGEITAPPGQHLDLAPGGIFTLDLNLQDYNVDRWFEPGVYEAWLEYLGEKSPPVRFGIEFAPDSVPRLAGLFLDSADQWIRERSFAWLQRLPDKPGLVLIPQGSKRPDAAWAEARNRENVRAFLERWPAGKETPPVRELFESVRLKLPAR